MDASVIDLLPPPAELLADSASFQALSEAAAESLLGLLPTVGLSADSHGHERIVKTFGIKKNQINRLLDQVRNTCSQVYKSANRSLERRIVSRDMAKAERSLMLLEEIFLSVEHRQTLLGEYIRLVRSGKQGQALPPVLELELLRYWSEDAELFNDQDAFGRARVSGYPGLTNELMIFTPTYTAGFFAHIEDVDLRNKFCILADDMVYEMAVLEDDEDGGPLMAGVFALAAMANCSAFINAISSLRPGLLGFLGHLDSSKGRFDSLLENLRTRHPDKALNSELAFAAIRGQYVLNDLRLERDLELVAMAHDEVSNCESLLLAQGNVVIEQLRADAAELDEAMTTMLGMFAKAGIALDDAPIRNRSAHWAEAFDFLDNARPSHERNEVLDELGAEVKGVSRAVAEGAAAALVAAQAREGILESESGWVEQARLITEAMKPLLEFAEFWEGFIGDAGGVPQVDYRVAGDDGRLTLGDTQALSDQLAQALAGLRDAPQKQAQLEAYQQQVEQLLEEKAKAEQALSCANSRVDSLRQENAEAKSQVETLKLSLASQSKPVQSASLPADYQKWVEDMACKGTACDVLKAIELFYSDRVVILESAYKAAETHKSSIPTPALLCRLKALATEGLDIVRKTGQIIDCKDVVPGEVAVQESETVRNNGKFNKLRTFPYNGGKHTFFPHLRINYSHRVYFDYMPDDGQRIVIGYVGQHLASDKSATV